MNPANQWRLWHDTTLMSSLHLKSLMASPTSMTTPL